MHMYVTKYYLPYFIDAFFPLFIKLLKQLRQAASILANEVAMRQDVCRGAVYQQTYPGWSVHISPPADGLTSHVFTWLSEP